VGGEIAVLHWMEAAGQPQAPAALPPAGGVAPGG